MMNAHTVNMKHVHSMKKQINKCWICDEHLDYQCQLSKHLLTHKEWPHCNEIFANYDTLMKPGRGGGIPYPLLGFFSGEEKNTTCKKYFRHKNRLNTPNPIPIMSATAIGCRINVHKAYSKFT